MKGLPLAEDSLPSHCPGLRILNNIVSDRSQCSRMRRYQRGLNAEQVPLFRLGAWFGIATLFKHTWSQDMHNCCLNNVIMKARFEILNMPHLFSTEYTQVPILTCIMVPFLCGGLFFPAIPGTAILDRRRSCVILPQLHKNHFTIS